MNTEGSSPSFGHCHVPGLAVICGLPRRRLLLGTSPRPCPRWGGSQASPLSPVLMRRVLTVLWDLILSQNGQISTTARLLAHKFQVWKCPCLVTTPAQTPGISLLPTQMTGNPRRCITQCPDNKAQGMTQSQQRHLASKALAHWSSRQWCWAFPSWTPSLI